MKSGKRHRTEEMELPNKDKIRTLVENETNKYVSILEADTIKQEEMKCRIQKEYLRRNRKLLETKLSSWNLIKGINAWAVPLDRYSGHFLKWTRREFKQVDQTDYMYQEKREEEDLPALKTTLTYRYAD